MQRKKSLAIREKLFGSDNPVVSNSRNELATLYGLQGNYALALPLLEKNLDVQEKALGPNVLNTLMRTDTDGQPPATGEESRTNAMILSGCYGQLCQAKRMLGRYGEAMDLAHRWQRLNERLFGSESPSVAESLVVQASIQSE